MNQKLLYDSKDKKMETEAEMISEGEMKKSAMRHGRGHLEISHAEMMKKHVMPKRTPME